MYRTKGSREWKKVSWTGYLKVVDSRELGEGLPMDVEDLNSMHLDLMAQKEGFTKGKSIRNNRGY